MAEAPAQERTEQPTLERLRDARKEGRIPQSKELPSALMIAILLVVLAVTGGSLYEFFVSQARQGLSLEMRGSMNLGGFSHLFRTKVTQSLVALSPFLLAAVGVSAFAGLLVGGWSVSAKAVAPKLRNINPLTGFKRLLSLTSLFGVLINLLKLGVMLAIIWIYVDGKLPAYLALRWRTPEGVLTGSARLLFGLVVRIAIAVLAIAVIDWLYQKWNYVRQLKMTKQEVRQEMKDREMSPLLKGRIRGVQMEMVRKRMLQEVPRADVVLTNPTHVAVALRYDAATMEAPTVVAKGPGLLCEKIKEIARAHNVPVVQKPELARTVYSAAEVGEAIPETLFVAVAEVLAMIYRTKRRHRPMMKDST